MQAWYWLPSLSPVGQAFLYECECAFSAFFTLHRLGEGEGGIIQQRVHVDLTYPVHEGFGDAVGAGLERGGQVSTCWD